MRIKNHSLSPHSEALSQALVVFILLGVLIFFFRSPVPALGLEQNIQLGLHDLPSSLAFSFLRMLLAYFFATLFSFFFGLFAARSRLGEKVILPILDVLQSVPIVAFFPPVLLFFLGIFGESRIAVECSAVLLIFTSQAWNLCFSVYESVKTIPQQTLDAAMSFGIEGRQRFWKIYVPTCFPRFIFNSILSWSNGWFFLVACEIIALGPMQFYLPGIGSFLAISAQNDQVDLVLYGILSLGLFVLFLDLFLWRPLTGLSDKYKNELSDEEEEESFFQTTKWSQFFIQGLRPVREVFYLFFEKTFKPVFLGLFRVFEILVFYPVSFLFLVFQKVDLFLVGELKIGHHQYLKEKQAHYLRVAIWGLIALGMLFGLAQFFLWLFSDPFPSELLREIPYALLASTGRVVIAMLLSALWVVPLLLWLWNSPKQRKLVTTIAQVGASVPATALFPLFVFVIAERFPAGLEVASVILLITGMQWYLLFNGLSGVNSIPADYIQTMRSFGIPKTSVWKNLVIPSIRVPMVTGLITAWGAGWNALVVSEYLLFKGKVLQVQGLGALLNQAVYENGNSKEIVLCVGVMVTWIVLINIFFWQKLYQHTISRYRMDE